MSRIHTSPVLAVLAGLSLAAALSPPTPAHAAGFVGSFDPSQWTLVNTSDNGVDTTIDQQLTGSLASCGGTTGNEVACVDTRLSASGLATLLGSTAAGNPAPAGGGSPFDLRTTTWSIPIPGALGGPPTLISFSWLFTAEDGGTQTASYLVGNTETALSSTSTTSPASVSSLLLQPGQTFGFRITTSDNLGAVPILNISNFSTAAVPGPLPMAGGVAAFAWSRRLRRRIRQAQS